MASSLFGLPLWHTSSWIFNAYVLGDETAGLTVVDPGLPSVATKALALVSDELGRPADDITSVMCTHGHPDHVAGVATLTAGCHADVLLPARCRDYLDGEHPRSFAFLDATSRFLPLYSEQPIRARALWEFVTTSTRVGFGGPFPFRIDFEPSEFLADGDPVPGADGWQALHTPGHTDDSTCLYHPDSATLVSGDAVVTQDGAAWFNPEYVDLDLARQTEERLRSLEVRHLLPGHGHPIEAADVWANAKSPTDMPSGSGLLARCSRRIGRWHQGGDTGR